MSKMRTATGARLCRVGFTFALLTCAGVAGCSSDDGDWADDTPDHASSMLRAAKAASPLASTCPAPAAGAPTSTWADCSVGLDPTKNGGDLLWAKAMSVNASYCDPWGPPLQPSQPIDLAVGPTGDIAFGGMCSSFADRYSVVHHLNGSGVGQRRLEMPAGGTGNVWVGPRFDRRNELVVAFDYQKFSEYGWIAIYGASGAVSYSYNSPGWVFGVFSWDSDALGNNFFRTQPGPSVERVSSTAQSSLHFVSDSFVADQTGGIFRFGTLQDGLNVGCGPMFPPSETGGTKGYIVRLDPAWGCVYSRVVSAPVAVLADGSGGAILSATSSKAIDLGCGLLPSAPGGSTFVTRLNAAGNCVFGKSLSAPQLKVSLDASGRVVLSGLAGAAAVDLGGGPLQPKGSQDIIVGELDASGNHLWSKRFGGPGITFGSPSVSTSAAGDVYLRTSSSSPVDLGGGAVSGSPLIGSFSPSGAHRWSRGLQITGSYQMGFDGCGALVVASVDPNFDPGCGQVIPPPVGWPSPDPNAAIARFAP